MWVVTEGKQMVRRKARHTASLLYFLPAVSGGVLGGRCAGAGLKRLAEVIYAGKTAGFRHLCDGTIGIRKEQLCLLKPQLQNILFRRGVVLPVKLLSQITLADMGHLRQYIVTEVGIRQIFFDIADRVRQRVLSPVRTGCHLLQQPVKCRKYLQPAFFQLQQTLQRFTIPQTALRIGQWDRQDPVAGKTGALKIDDRKHALFVAVNAIIATQRQKYGMVWIRNDLLLSHGICQLSADAKGQTKAGAILHPHHPILGKMHGIVFLYCRNGHFVKQRHFASPHGKYTIFDNKIKSISAFCTVYDKTCRFLHCHSTLLALY